MKLYRAYSYTKFTTRQFLRSLHLYMCKESAAEQITPLNQEVSRVSLGVGGVALYGGGGNSCVWYNSLSSAHTSTPHSLVSPEGSKCVDVQWDCLQLPEGETATSVSIGQTHLVALTNSHNAYAVGENKFGECGYHSNKQSDKERKKFIKMQGLVNPLKQIACGLDHTLLLTQSSKIISCGWSADGQTGVSHYGNVYSPTVVNFPAGQTVMSVHTCSDSSFALTKTGHVFAWGNNEYGQLGLATEDKQVCSPDQIHLSDLDSEVVAVAVGGAFTGILTVLGSVYIVGYTVENPQLCVENGRTVINPTLLSKWRKLHESNGVEKFNFIHAGLNYLVAGYRGDSAIPRKLLVWGRSPVKVTSRIYKQEMQVDESVVHMCFGPMELAAILRDNSIDSTHTVLTPFTLSEV